MPDFEKLGSFYLGRKHDLASGETGAELVLYDSRDLTTHAVCVGMTGSGKTGLCLSLIEEAALDGIPVIAVDPKGDLGNLLLAFPELQPSDFRPWIDPAIATQKGFTPDQLAEQTAELWRNGLAEWAEDGKRIERFNQRVEKTIYTPGSSAGVPLTVLKSFSAPSQAVLDDSDALRDRVQSTASSLLVLLEIDADPVRSREHIFLSNLLEQAWRAGRGLDLPSLIQEIQQPPFEKVGVIDLEQFFPAKDRFELGLRLNNLLASPSFASWLEGEPLDVQKLLYTSEGRPRLSILSIAHLAEAERMFFVTILLGEMVSWMRAQQGTSSLRALLYMDEVFGYFPPIAKPPTKPLMLTLLKQARAYGLGVMLATQNPVDLDYKGLSNAGTWFLGRLQTERDKARVIEGLEGASIQAGASFDRPQVEATLAGLDNRVFLMNNVHENQPQVFRTRWAMSYLRGPLTRDQIRTLMADRMAELAAEQSAKAGAAAAPEVMPSTTTARPVVTASISQKFWPVSDTLPREALVQYRPALFGSGKLHFVRASYKVDQWRDAFALQSVHGELREPVWDSAMVFESVAEPRDEPAAGTQFADLPSPLANEKNYSAWEKQLVDYLYRTARYDAWRCEALEATSDPGETEGEFRIRVTQLAREKRDEEKEAVRKAERYHRQQRSQFWMRVVNFFMVIAEVVLGALGLGKSRRLSSTSAKQAMQERGEASRAAQRLKDKQHVLEELSAEQQAALDQLQLDFEPANLALEKLELPPVKSDIRVDRVIVIWLPWHTDEHGTAQPAY